MKICCVFNYNPLYRFPIYNAMGETFDCDFFFGDSVFEPLKQFNPTELKGFIKYINAKKIPLGYIWHSGIRKIFSTKYDAFIIGGSQVYVVNWLVMIFAKIFRKKVLYWTHGFKKPVNLKKISLARLYHSMIDQYLVYNEFNTRYMLEAGIPKKKINVIYNSLDSQVQTDIYNTLQPSTIYQDHFKNNNPVLIFIGRIQKRMKVELLIEAVHALKKDGIMVNTVIVGAYMNGVDIQELVSEYGLEKQVWMYGPSFNERQNSELLYNADVCVAPGTVGLTAIHSLSYGTPCITHNNFTEIGPEFEAIREGVTGAFFEENDAKSLVEAIKKWIGHNEERRNNTRRYAREEIEQHWCVNKQIELLNTVLSNYKQ